MFRYRQTQQLQRDLERRFSRLLKPFGLGPSHESHPDVRGTSGATTQRRSADKAAPSAKHMDDHVKQAS